MNLTEWSEFIVASKPELVEIKPSLENELLAMATFDVLAKRQLLPNDAVFIGGTSLRLCHGSPRVSEDLDFHTAEFAERKLDRKTLADEVGAIIGFDVEVSMPTAKNRATLARISAIIPERERIERRPHTKIDLGRGIVVDAQKTIVTLRMAAGGVPGMGNIGEPFMFPTSSTEEIFADKHIALVGRSRRIKQRDVFDLLWLRCRNVEFRPDLIAAKLPSGKYDAFVSMLRRRASDGKDGILNGDYHAEMRRFLPSNSSWLFDEPRQNEGMAQGFETLIFDHAKAVQRELTRTIVQKPKGITR